MLCNRASHSEKKKKQFFLIIYDIITVPLFFLSCYTRRTVSIKSGLNTLSERNDFFVNPSGRAWVIVAVCDLIWILKELQLPVHQKMFYLRIQKNVNLMIKHSVLDYAYKDPVRLASCFLKWSYFIVIWLLCKESKTFLQTEDCQDDDLEDSASALFNRYFLCSCRNVLLILDILLQK